MKIVIVTGASSGIGAEFVRQLDENFQRVDEIWMIARDRKKMEALGCELKNKSRVLALDLLKKEDRTVLRDTLQVEKPGICMLVNCAGFGVMGEFISLDLEEQLEMIDLNCRVLTEVTYTCLPYMIRNGRILQVASSAAFAPQANFAVYGATKSYVLSFARALQEEVRAKEIFITAVCPGPVDTPFFDRAEKNGHTLKLKKRFTVSAARVVKDALTASKKRKTVAVCSFPMKVFRFFCKVISHDILLEIVQHFSEKEEEKDEVGCS